VRDLVVARLRTLAVGIAAAHGAEATLEVHNVAIPTINASEPTEVAIRAAQAFAASVATSIDPVMGGEDFGDMLAARPGAFIFLGNGDSAALHNPHYDFNDDAIPSGVAWFVNVAEQRLAQP
jgi:hippurate hydrolase